MDMETFSHHKPVPGGAEKKKMSISSGDCICISAEMS